MRLILARHGNTFAPGDKVVWVGRSQDLPLVQRGEEQARQLAHALRRARIKPATVYCGPLLRTRRAAEILVADLAIARPPVVDERLAEIDYGLWGGLSSDEIVTSFGEEDLLAWQGESRWPESGRWRPTASQVAAAVCDLTKEIVGRHASEETVVLVSSSGVLRYFLSQLPGQFKEQLRDGGVKVSTGHVCELEQRDGRLQLVFWNRHPSVVFV